MSIMTSMAGVVTPAGGASPGPPTWNAKTSSFGSDDIITVGYGNGVWVAGGKSGKLATSTDGDNWTQRTSSFGSDWVNGVHYDSSIWVAVGNGGKVATATDPTGTWTQRTSDTTDAPTEVMFDGSDWCACCWGGHIITVADPPTDAWTEDAEAGQWYSIFYGTGLFIMGGTGGACKTAPDPTGAWTSRNPQTGGSTIINVYFDGVTYWLASAASGKMSTSTDGITWTARTVNLGTNNLGGSCFGNGYYVQGGANGVMAWATDPTGLWTAYGSTPVSDTIRDIDYNGTYFIAVGSDGELMKGTF